MPKPKPEEIQHRFKNLPRDLKEAIFGVDTADAIQSIGKKHALTIDGVGQLADEVGLFMLGFTKPEDFVGVLQNRLAVDFETARGITEDLNVQIFAKVRDSLKRAHAMEENHVVPIPPQTPPRPAEVRQPANEGGPPPFAPTPSASPFESKLQEKVFSAQKELSEAREQKIYPGGRDPYRAPLS